ncbi:response regulator [Patescibacteria group bacterium]|nr:response regulator [Patescibacteria group bacterium]
MPTGKLIYIIDDDTLLLEIYALKFQEYGLPVEAIPDATLALEKLRAGARPDLIMVDIIMPKMSGFDFLEALKREQLAGGATLVVLTNQSQEEEVARANQLGVKEYIIKSSAIPSEICEKVRALCAS